MTLANFRKTILSLEICLMKLSFYKNWNFCLMTLSFNLSMSVAFLSWNFCLMTLACSPTLVIKKIEHDEITPFCMHAHPGDEGGEEVSSLQLFHRVRFFHTCISYV